MLHCTALVVLGACRQWSASPDAVVKPPEQVVQAQWSYEKQLHAQQSRGMPKDLKSDSRCQSATERHAQVLQVALRCAVQQDNSHADACMKLPLLDVASKEDVCE